MLIKNPKVAAMAEKSQEEIRNKSQQGAGVTRPAAASSSSSAASSATSAIRAEDLEALMMNEAASSRRASQPTPVPETLTRNAVLDEILGSEGSEWSDMLEQTPEEEEDDERTRERLLRLYQLGTVPEVTAVAPATAVSPRQASPPPPPLPTFQSRFSSERGEIPFLFFFLTLICEEI